MMTEILLALMVVLMVKASRVLVVYSGPTTLDCASKNTKQHHTNFLWFVNHGLPSPAIASPQDEEVVVLVLTASVRMQYSTLLDHLQARHGPHQLRIMERKNRCYDMESHALALTTLNNTDAPDHHRDSSGGSSADEFIRGSLTAFDFFVFVNCGVVGPILPGRRTLHVNFHGGQPARPHVHSYWPALFTQHFSATVRLVGLSLNCGSEHGRRQAHVQSMLWATDRVGLSAILRSGALHDCGQREGRLLPRAARSRLINRYELGLSLAVMTDGHAIAAPLNTLQSSLVYTLANATAKPFHRQCRDIWTPGLETAVDPSDMVFWKATRTRPLALRQRMWEAADRAGVPLDDPFNPCSPINANGRGIDF